jgi:hypothetical protein
MTEEDLDNDDPVDDEDEEQDSSARNVQFSLEISPDRDDFLRRTCPSCGRDFKTEIDLTDVAWALNTQIHRVSLEVGIPPSEIEQEGTPETLRCPYCLHKAEGSEMHTDETIEYLKLFAYRDYALPLVSKMLSDIADSFGSSSGGFISISLSHERPLTPPRPIHGPEPADMKIVFFLCCGKKIKVTDKWMDVTQCTFCGTEVTLV